MLARNIETTESSYVSLNGAAGKLQEDGTRAYQPDRPLHPLDGRRETPDRKRMVIRSPDGAARSVRAIVWR